MLDWRSRIVFRGDSMRNWVLTVGGLGCALLLSGCPKGNSDCSQGTKAETVQDYVTALIHYEKALKSNPRNIEYKIKATRLRFEAGQYHVRQGQKDREKGDLQLAMAEFQKALAIDPSSAIAEQEIRQTLELIASKRAADEAGAAAPKPPAEEALAARPPELKPLSRSEEHTSELQSPMYLVCRLLLEKKKHCRPTHPT